MYRPLACFATPLFVVASLLWSSPSHALGVDDARYLLGRTGFGASPGEIQALLPLTREQAVDHLLAGLRTQPVLPEPRVAAMPKPNYDLTNATDASSVNEVDELQQWWIDEMISTPSAMTERLVLFWHNHFVSKILTGNVSAPMYDQLQLFRSHAAGDMRSLLRGVVRDPMMLSFLDNIDNKREHPNENLARELMELFTLGPGHYTEHDVKELARVLTGHGVDRGGGWRYRFVAADHDGAPVDFLGHRGVLDIDAALDIILAQPAAATFIAQKFVKEFVNPEPDDAQVEALANQLRQTDFQIKPMLRSMLTSAAFWAPQQRGSMPKSPVDLVVGFARSFGVAGDDAYFLSNYTEVLGQTLMDPPSVAGWPGGFRWLSSASLARQKQVLDRLWAAYAVGKEVASHPKDRGLRIRLSNEYTGRQALVRLLVNGQPLGTYRLRHGLNAQQEPASDSIGFIKPAWEEIHVDADALPRVVKTVALQTLNSSYEDLPNEWASVFLNWIQLDGDRYPAHRAHRVQAPADCESPLGMMYCSEALQFDIPELKNAYARAQAWQEDLASTGNETIEIATPRETSVLRAAARSPRRLAQPLDAELQPLLPRVHGTAPTLLAALQPFVLPIEPMRPDRLRDPGLRSPLQMVVAMTNDPAYLLK